MIRLALRTSAARRPRRYRLIWFCDLQAEREGALERFGMAIGHELVPTSTTFGFRAFRAEQVTEARRAAHELALGGHLEPLGNGLLGLLHGKSVRKQTSTALVAR